ncbi:unnamed protein product [Ascophyllum nodosum]
MSDGATPDGAGSAATKVLSLAKAEILDQKKKRRKTNKDAMVAKASSSIPTTAAPNGASAVALGVGTNENATASTTWVVPQPKKTKKEKKKCSFFNKKKGCRSGALCPFLHEGVEMGGSRVASNVKPPLPEESPVEVKASRDAVTSTNGTPMAKPLLPTPGKPFVAVDHPAATPTPRVSLPTSGALPSTPTAHDSGVGSDRLTRKRGRSKTANAVQHLASPSASSGLLDGLPVSPFVTAAASAKEQGHGPLGGVGLVDKAEAAPEGIPHVRADPWQELVELTRAHPRYAKNYAFDTDATWIKASPCGDACAGLPQVVAVDCEMCISEDPVSGKRNSKELVRMSIVRGQDGERLVDTLVRPANPVVDWITDIHGVGPEQMGGVHFMHRHAQAAMSRICCERTVIIGHALSSDLAALKMTHSRVIDTSLIYQGQDKELSTPSLKDVVKVIMGKDIQDGSHDSVIDAQCALDVARFALERHGAPLPFVTRTKKSVRRGIHKARKRNSKDGEDEGEESRALLVHRLPAGTTEQQLLRVMQKKTRMLAVKARAIVFSGAMGKSHVVYGSVAEVDMAFNAISSAANEDMSGRLQKRIFLSKDGKRYITVRHPRVMNKDDGGLPSISSSESESSSTCETE